MTSIDQGWQAIARGDDAEAGRIFEQHIGQDASDSGGYRGLGLIEALRGNLARAKRFAEQAAEQDMAAENQLLMGEILGRQGERVDAQHQLQHYLSREPDNAYARALYAEQLLRQGLWDEGTEAYIEALSRDPERLGFRQVQRVLRDMVQAANQGRIPAKEAMKLVNRLDYSVPAATPDMSSFFAEVRRALNNRRTVTIDHDPTRLAATTFAGHAVSTSRAAAAPPARASVPSSPSPPPPSSADAPPAAANRGPSRPAPSRQSAAGGGRGGVDANQKDLAAIIKQERSLNADLLSGIANLPAPKWPSEDGYTQLDTVPSVASATDDVLSRTANIEEAGLQITSGEITTEIVLERCLRNLLVATQKDKPTTVDLRPESVAQVELNCRAGLLDELPQLSDIYDEVAGRSEVGHLALGMFLGTCAERTHDATWRFTERPEDSTLAIGQVVLRPFDLTRRWLDAADKDDVDLDLLARQAEVAASDHAALTIAQGYIDPTREMTGDGLRGKLASLWTDYYLYVAESQLAQITRTTELVADEPTAVTFKVGEAWAPDFAQGPRRSGVDADGRVTIGYLRRTGKFLPLASRKGLARFLGATLGALDGENAGRAVEALARFHRPRYAVAGSDAGAAKLRERTANAEASGPRLAQEGQRRVLTVHGANQTAPVRWRIAYDPSALLPWSVDVSGE